MKARIVDNVVVEILTPVPGFSIEQCFHPDILKTAVNCGADVQVGWVKQEDGTLADPNAAPVAPEPEPEPEPAPEPTPEPPAE